jgi:hypothetical protein
MDGVFYAIFGIAILLLIRWYMRNDKGLNTDGNSGLFAMRTPPAPERTSTRSSTGEPAGSDS